MASNSKAPFNKVEERLRIRYFTVWLEAQKCSKIGLIYHAK